MMQQTTYTRVERATGRVAGCGVGFNPQTMEDEAFEIKVGVFYRSGYYDNNVYFPLPEQPSEHHVFDYITKQWVDPRTPETEWGVVRAQRGRLLQESDWTQLPDVPLATKEAWATYRQALRDVTLQPDPLNIVWPTPPA
jgi:hypothetical protein